MTLSDDQLERARQEAADSPTVWFAVLERARLANDAALVEEAQHSLLRLGVTVTFDRLPGQVMPA